MAGLARCSGGDSVIPRIESLTTVGGELCPVCGAVAAPAAVFPDYQLHRCRACGCWSSDAHERGATTSFEPETYFENADLDRPKWAALLRSLEARDRRVRSLLDVGCGTGAFLGWVSQAHPDIDCEGIEIDTDRASEARDRNPRAVIHVGDAAETLSGSSRRYDLITLWDVFEHVTAPVHLLRELAAHLVPGGSIHIVTIHERSLLPAIGRALYRLSARRFVYPIRRTHEAHHLVFFTRSGLERAARESGLRIRALWFDRLRRGRMDGHPIVTAVTAALLSAENALGNGLFVNLTLEKA